MHKIKRQDQLAIIRELWRTRDELASTKDIAGGKLLNDSAIIELAMKAPTTKRDFEKILRPLGLRAQWLENSPLWLGAIERAVALPQELGALSNLLAQWGLDRASETTDGNPAMPRPVHAALLADVDGAAVRYAQVAYRAQLLPLLGDAQAQDLPGATGDLARQPWRVQWHTDLTALEHPAVTHLSSGQLEHSSATTPKQP